MVIKFLEQFVLIARALERPGPLRRRGRVLLRPARAPVGRVDAGEGADDLGPDPAAARRRAADAGRRRAPAAGQALRAAARELGGDRRDAWSAACASSATSGRVLVSVIDPERPPADAAGVLRRGGVPLAARAPRRSRSATRATRTRSTASPGATIDYEPAESTTDDVRRQLELARPGLDARSTTWRSASSSVYQRFFGDDFTVEYPTGSGQRAHASGRSRRTSPTGSSRSGCPAPTAAARSTAAPSGSRSDPAWKDNLLFYEYFHGDNGAGLGAMHQTGWTALVADLILDPPAAHTPLGAVEVPKPSRTRAAARTGRA